MDNQYLPHSNIVRPKIKLFARNSLSMKGATDCGSEVSRSDQQPNIQTWNLSKNLHRWIFRLKILHRQFYLISTVLVRKKHKKWVKMEKFTPPAKILHCRWHWRDGQIPPLVLNDGWWVVWIHVNIVDGLPWLVVRLVGLRGQVQGDV